MKAISLPASTPLTLVTTASGASPDSAHLLFELHTPTQNLLFRFGDIATLEALRRALHLLLADARRLPGDAVTSRVFTVHGTSRRPRQLNLL